MIRTVRIPAPLAILWTAVSVFLVLFAPAAPPICTSIEPAGCAAFAAAAQDEAWWRMTLPLLVLIVGGYVIVGVVALRALWRRRAPQGG